MLQLTEHDVATWCETMDQISLEYAPANRSQGIKQVSDTIYCAPFEWVLKNPESVNAAKITHIICCTPHDLPVSSVQILRIPCMNSSNFLAENFLWVESEINRIKEQDGLVLILCMSGVNKAGVLTAGYLMKSDRKPLTQVIRNLTGILGPVIAPNSLKTELIKLANELELLE